MKKNTLTKAAYILLPTLLLGILAFTSHNGTGDKLAHDVHATEVITLDSSHAPTTSETFVPSVTYTGIEYATYTYTKVKASAGKLGELDAGGTLTKDIAKGLTEFKAKFTGSLTVETWFTPSDTSRSSFELVDDVFSPICGNYFLLTANEATVIESITIKYSCYEESLGHDWVEGTPFLNGDDYDRIDTCSNCGTERLVEMVTKGDYRMGSFVLAATQAGNVATYTQTTETVEGVENPSLFANPTRQWGNRLAIDLVNHHQTKDPIGVRNEVLRLDAKYFQFQMLARPGSIVSVHAMTDKSFGNTGTSHTRVDMIPGATIDYATNPGIKIYRPGSPLPATTFETNVWYKVVVDYTNVIWPVTSGQYTSIELSYTQGNIYLDDVRYYHVNPIAEEDLNFLDVQKSNYELVVPNVHSFINHGLETELNLNINAYYNGALANDYEIELEDNDLVDLVGGKLVAKGEVGKETLELSYSKGVTVLLTNIVVDVRGPEVHDGSEFVFFTNRAEQPNTTYNSVGEHVGKTGIYKVTGSGASYVNQLDVKLTSQNSPATHEGNYSALKNAGITHISYDLMLGTSNASTRLQSRTKGSGGFNTNLVQVGQTYKAYSGTFNDKIHIYYDNGLGELVQVDENYVFAMNVWYLVVVDISFVLTQDYSAGGYMNVSVTAPLGDIYLGNVTYYCPKN